MKIWIDLRFIKDELYSRFIVQLVKSMIETEIENEYIIYSNKNIEWINSSNLSIKKVNIKIWSFKEQTNFLKILKKDNNNLMLFFNHFKPVFYKKEYITFVWSLKDIYYMNFNSHIKKYKYLYLMEKNYQNSYKVVCLDQNTKNELIEKFNIKEEKINILEAFFPNNWLINNKTEELPVSVKAKYNINNEYFIYSWWDSIEKNYEKLVNVFSRLKNNWENIDLVFLWENISKNINLRNLILDNKLEKNVFFLWSIPLVDKELLYNKSIWTIFPSFYEPFPFRLTEPLHFGWNILSSDLKNTKEVFWDKIEYFSPISVNSIYEVVSNFIKTNKEKYTDYNEVKQKYTIENSTKQLIEIIK